jgi:hypothetical protein
MSTLVLLPPVAFSQAELNFFDFFQQPKRGGNLKCSNQGIWAKLFNDTVRRGVRKD